MKTRCALIAILAALWGAEPAQAQETATSADWFSQAGALEIIAARDGSSGADVSSVIARGAYSATVRLGDRLTLQGLATLWPMKQPTSDAFLDGEGVFAEEVAIHYAGEGFSLYTGKFDPAFGSAFNLAPGIYGKEIGQSYQTVEKLGVGGDIDLSGHLPNGLPGAHVLSFSMFKADRSVLSGSMGFSRPRLAKADGGPANTSKLNSWALSLDGETPAGLGYTFGVRKLAGGLDDDADERGFVAGAHSTPKTSEGLSLGWMAEVASFENADSVRGARRQSYTLGATLGVSEWSGSAILSGVRGNYLAGEAQRRFELSVGRSIAAGVTLDAGVQFVRGGGSTSTFTGIRLSYAFGAA
jgi:hypothetical protein